MTTLESLTQQAEQLQFNYVCNPSPQTFAAWSEAVRIARAEFDHRTAGAVLDSDAINAGSFKHEKA